MNGDFLIFLIIVYGFLFLGYGVKRALPATSHISRPLSIYILIFITPVIILNAFWSINFNNILISQLPVIHVLIVSISLIPAFLIVKILRLNNNEKGSFIACTMFSNIGLTLGGFLCFLLYGEKGLYLAGLYAAFFIPYYYLIGFTLMRTISGKKNTRYTNPLSELIRNPSSVVPLSLMGVGLILNLTGIGRPAILNYVATRWLIYISAAGHSFAIGLGLNFQKSIKYIKHSIYISAIKFVFNPLVGFALIYLFGFLGIDDLIPSKVIFIESFMPTAIMSVILVKIFELNEDLSNSAWILTNLFAIPIIPIMIALSRSF